MNGKLPLSDSLTGFKGINLLKNEEEKKPDRFRLYPHERNQWTTFAFVEFDQQLIENLINEIEDKEYLNLIDDSHLSLVRGHFTVNYHHIKPLIDLIKSSTSVYHQFSVCLSDLVVFKNENKSKCFLCLLDPNDPKLNLNKAGFCTAIRDSILQFDFSNSLNSTQEFNFHLSIAWCESRYERQLTELIDELKRQAAVQPVLIKVNEFKCKTVEMVQTGVGFDPAKKDLTQLDYMVASTCSSVATRFVAQPFDVLKIRFQLQVEPISSSNANSKYKSFGQAVGMIIKEEGVTALWKGHLPGQVLSIVYGTTQFSSFELLTKITYKFFHGIEHSKMEKKNMHDLKHHTGLGHPEHHPKTYSKLHEPEGMIIEHLLCGSVAGCVGTLTSFPLDVVRTRLISQGNPKVYRSMWDAVVKIYKREGIRGYYKGLMPSLIQIIPFSGLLFGFNRLFKQLWHRCITSSFSDEPESLGDSYKNNMQAVLHVIESGFCGAAAGFAAKSIVYPLDLLKKRLQVQGFGYARREFGAHHDYNSLLDGIRQIYKTESITGFYKGIVPSLLKSGFSTSMQFIVYEEIIRLLIKHRKEKRD